MKQSKSLAILVSCVLGFSAVNSFAGQERFRLVGDAPTGSLIRSTDLISPIPLDKRYYELSAEQKNKVRGLFSSLSSNQIPPFPVGGMKAIYKPIIAEHKKRAKGGTLSLLATVNENGRVESLSVAQSPTKKMAEVSAAVLNNIQFDPAFCAGEPCKMEFPIEIKFY